jgi:hypothetical protein
MFAAFYPFAVFYSAIYTEAVMLLAAMGAIYHFRRSEFVKCACFGLLAGFVRPNGFLLSAPLGLFALIDFARGRGWLPRGVQAREISWASLAGRLAVAALPALSLAAYSTWVYRETGNPFAWASAQQAWGRSTNGFARMIVDRQQTLQDFGVYVLVRSYAVEVMEGAAAVFALIGAWAVFRRFGLPYAVFVAMWVLPPLLSLGTTSLGRYTSPLFPIFLWLGASVSPARRPYVLAGFAAGQALIAALFFTWRAPY